MSALTTIEPEYIYVTIPAEYICVYHRILVMMADFGEEMLKDCKATCTNRNTNIIECFNMFNAAVAARKLNKDKLAETIIKYIKAKINQIYKNADNSTSFIFPIDETGKLKAFVSCASLPTFQMDAEDAQLYLHKTGSGLQEHFSLGEEDEFPIDPTLTPDKLIVEFTPSYEKYKNTVIPCAEITIKYEDTILDYTDVTIDYYFDNIEVTNFKDVTNVSIREHEFMLVVTYKGVVKIAQKRLAYEGD